MTKHTGLDPLCHYSGAPSGGGQASWLPDIDTIRKQLLCVPQSERL